MAEAAVERKKTRADADKNVIKNRSKNFLASLRAELASSSVERSVKKKSQLRHVSVQKIHSLPKLMTLKRRYRRSIFPIVENCNDADRRTDGTVVEVVSWS